VPNSPPRPATQVETRKSILPKNPNYLSLTSNAEKRKSSALIAAKAEIATRPSTVNLKRADSPIKNRSIISNKSPLKQR